MTGRRQVDDGESSMAQAGFAIDVQAAIIRAAVRQYSRHPRECIAVDWFAVPMPQPGDSTHQRSSLTT